MRLISATPIPYARKVRIALAKKSVPFEVLTEVPWNDDTNLPPFNPLEKLPVLILDDGSTLSEGSLILERIASSARYAAASPRLPASWTTRPTQCATRSASRTSPPEARSATSKCASRNSPGARPILTSPAIWTV